MMPRSTVDFVGKTDYVMTKHLPAMFHRDTGKYKIDGYVHIQAGWEGKQPMDAAGETQWLMTLEDQPLAIVGEAHLHDLAHLDQVLDAHEAASHLFKGVRDMIARHPAKGVMDFNHTGDVLQMDTFKQGYARLAERGLTYDAFLYAQQLKDFVKLVNEVPQTKVVLDHVGTPIALAAGFAGLGNTAEERHKIKEHWYEDLAALAEMSHVHMKLSGLLMPILGYGFEKRRQTASVTEVVDNIGPHLEFALDKFGVERCMFASNFPMDKVSVDYETLYDAYFQLVSSYSIEDQQKLFAGNALSFYSI